MTYKAFLVPIILLSIVGCAEPGSIFAGVGTFPEAPHGCGLFDTWTPETGSMAMDARKPGVFGVADAQATSICNEEVYRQKFYKEWESPARLVE